MTKISKEVVNTKKALQRLEGELVFFCRTKVTSLYTLKDRVNHNQVFKSFESRPNDKTDELLEKNLCEMISHNFFFSDNFYFDFLFNAVSAIFLSFFFGA